MQSYHSHAMCDFTTVHYITCITCKTPREVSKVRFNVNHQSITGQDRTGQVMGTGDGRPAIMGTGVPKAPSKKRPFESP